MRKRTLILYPALVLLLTFVWFQWGLQASKEGQVKVALAPVHLKGELGAMAKWLGSLSPSLAGTQVLQVAMPKPVGQTVFVVIPLIMFGLGAWQLATYRKGGRRDRLSAGMVFFLGLMFTLGLFLAWGKWANTHYKVTETWTLVNDGRRKVEGEIAGKFQELEAQGITDVMAATRELEKQGILQNGKVNLEALLGFKHCPGLKGNAACAWQFSLKDKNVTMDNYAESLVPHPFFEELGSFPLGIVQWLGWLGIFLGFGSNLNLWLDRLSGYRVGVDRIYDEGLPIA